MMRAGSTPVADIARVGAITPTETATVPRNPSDRLSLPTCLSSASRLVLMEPEPADIA